MNWEAASQAQSNLPPSFTAQCSSVLLLASSVPLCWLYGLATDLHVAKYSLSLLTLQ